jgi:hypothetical protein
VQNRSTDHKSLSMGMCDLLKQSETVKNMIRNVGGNWPLTNLDVANNYTKYFQMFVKSIKFDTL